MSLIFAAPVLVGIPFGRHFGGLPGPIDFRFRPGPQKKNFTLLGVFPLPPPVIRKPGTGPSINSEKFFNYSPQFSSVSPVTRFFATCIFFNATTSDQYLAIVVPGRMFSSEFKNRGLKPENLSRTLEDSGTVTSPLIPWNTCGAYHAGVLGVATGTYWMFCFFNLISPIMTVLYGFLNIRIRKYSTEEEKTE